MNTNASCTPASHDNHERFIAVLEEGIEIQWLQYVTRCVQWFNVYLIFFKSQVRHHASIKDFCQDTLNGDQQHLQKTISHWRIQYRKLFPQVFPFVSTDYPENEPSSYPLLIVQTTTIVLVLTPSLDLSMKFGLDEPMIQLTT